MVNKKYLLCQSTKETPGFEPGTIRSAVERSTTELYLQKKIYDSNEVRTPRVVEWSSSQWTCRVPAGSGGAYYQQLFSEWWEFPMPLTRLIRPCHPKNLSVNHLYPIEFKPIWVTSASINCHTIFTPATEG